MRYLPLPQLLRYQKIVNPTKVYRDSSPVRILSSAVLRFVEVESKMLFWPDNGTKGREGMFTVCSSCCVPV